MEDTAGDKPELICPPQFSSKLEQTLALLKPDAYEKAEHIINIIRREGFTILQARRVQLTPEQASEFYRDKYEEEWFQDAVDHITAGNVMALCLSGPTAIEHWRRLMGPPTYLKRMKYPTCLRQQFGVPGSDIKNAVHGSEDETQALRELKFFFPQLIIEPVLADNLTSFYLNQHVHPVLTVGLSKLVRERPDDPLLWLADWLLTNNPNKPKSLSGESCQ